MATAVRRRCLTTVAVLATIVLMSTPAHAHPEVLTPYHSVVAPPGVSSQGLAESGSSLQPLGQFGFAGTTDNQMQLTLPEGALLPRSGETGVRVQLDQLAPASLPALPAGLDAEGNGYRVRLSYAPSGAPLTHLDAPATLGLSAPAPPTALYELLDGTWQKADFTPVTADTGFTSVIALNGPGTFLQAYDAAAAPASISPTSPAAPGIAEPTRTARSQAATAGTESGQRSTPWRWVLVGGGLVVLASGLAAFDRRRRQSAHRAN